MCSVRFGYFGDQMGYFVVSVFGTAAVAFAILSRYATDLRYFRYLAFGLLSCGTGFLLQTAGIPANVAANSLIATALYLTGALSVAEAVQRRSTGTMGRIFHAAVFALALLATSYFLFIDRNLLARTYILNFGFGFVLLAAVWKEKQLAQGSGADRLLFWTIAIIGLHFFPRTLFTAGSFSVGPGEHTTTAFWITLQYTLAIILNAGVLALLGVAGADIFTTIARDRDTDVLTGLLNRRGIETAIRSVSENGVTRAVIVADLDSFKAINDRFGHAVGDEVLQVVAGRLAKVSRKKDLLGRIGGEEFVFVIEGNLEEAISLAERFRTTLAAEPIQTGSTSLTVTASFGISLFFSNDDFWKAVKAADTELYTAKREGKNMVAWSGPRLTGQSAVGFKH